MMRAAATGRDSLPIVLVDMDGTLAQVRHRLHHIRRPGRKDWKKFFAGMDADPPNGAIVNMVRELAAQHRIVIVTGRPEQYRQRTLAWLERHEVPSDEIYMRRDGDHRPDYVVKREMLEALGPDQARIALVIDDRPSVCDMWRGCGLKVHQVDNGEDSLY